VQGPSIINKRHRNCYISCVAPKLYLFPGPGSLNPIFRPRGFSKQVGDVFGAAGVYCATNLHMEMGSFASPQGKMHFQTNAPKQKHAPQYVDLGPAMIIDQFLAMGRTYRI